MRNPSRFIRQLRDLLPGSAPSQRQHTGSFSYECHTCGRRHEGMPSFGWEYPMEYSQLPEAERAGRTEITPDVCVIDGRWFFVRGCIEIPVHGYDEPFVYGVWVSLSQRSFGTFCSTYEADDREQEGPFFGWLTAVPLPYPAALLKTMVHPRPVPTRPLIELEPTDHPLAVDQRNGLSVTRVQEIAEALLHGDQ